MKKLKFILMRKITIKLLMDLVVKWQTGKLGKIPLAKKPSGLLEENSLPAHLQQLRTDGYTNMDKPVSAATLEKIRQYASTIVCYDTYKGENSAVDPMTAPPDTHVAYYRREDLVKCKPIMDIANDPGVLSLVQDFLGAKPTISNVNMWWSFSGRKQAEHAQLFHRDLDDWKFCKLFVYLTDVDSSAGPHIYVKGTSASAKLRKIRRYQDREIERTFGKENVISFTAPKGTAFIVDTYGFHKGLLPEKTDRLLLQVQYSLNPIAVENYEPIAGESSEYEPYINRLLIAAKK